MRNHSKYLTLCIDLEECDMLQEFGISISQEEQLNIGASGAQLLRDLFEKLKIRATFFITENMANAFPGLLELLVHSGHEIALHGILKGKGDKVINELKIQKLTIERISRSKVYGLRSHKLVYLSEQILRAADLTYDNSLHPTYVPGRYCNIFSPRNIYKENGIIRVPISVTPCFRLPFSWFWFRNLGLGFAKLCSRMVYVNQNYINIYFHSWDFINLESWPLKFRYKPLVRNTGNRLIAGMSNYINWCRQEKIQLVTMFNYIDNHYVNHDVKAGERR